MLMDNLTRFQLDGEVLLVMCMESEPEIYPGVTCHVYQFIGDLRQDLAIVEIEAEGKTPAQEVQEGERTVQLYVSGEGSLIVIREDGKKEVFEAKKDLAVEINVGDKMQWKAAKGKKLVFAEMCRPRYAEGRYKNLVEDLD
jgi:hypothetical protein